MVKVSKPEVHRRRRPVTTSSHKKNVGKSVYPVVDQVKAGEPSPFTFALLNPAKKHTPVNTETTASMKPSVQVDPKNVVLIKSNFFVMEKGSRARILF